MNELIISENNISLAWIKIFQNLLSSPGKEIYSQIVSVDLTDGINENKAVKDILNEEMENINEKLIETVASTIFPKSLWNPTGDRKILYDTYMKSWPKFQ